MRLAALVEYDGTRFKGFQRQPPTRGATVQGEIEAALQRLTGAAVTIEGAGRTDSGVHARGQVMSFTASARLDEDGWQRALNAHLPPDVAIRAVCAVGDDFHARRSATARSYRYRILCDSARAPLRERYAWRVAQRLDREALAEAVALLRGEHDFGAFGSSPHDRPAEGFRAHTVRVMHEARCVWPTADEIECCFTANAFLTGMVRRMVGTVALVAEGRLSLTEFRAIFAARDKAHRGAAAPACGLCLTAVTYPPGLVSWEQVP